METIIVQIRSGSQWAEVGRVEDAQIRDYRITPEQVAQYVREHPSPLARLFTPPPVYRVVYRLESEVERFSVSV